MARCLPQFTSRQERQDSQERQGIHFYDFLFLASLALLASLAPEFVRDYLEGTSILSLPKQIRVRARLAVPLSQVQKYSPGECSTRVG